MEEYSSTGLTNVEEAAAFTGAVQSPRLHWLKRRVLLALLTVYVSSRSGPC